MRKYFLLLLFFTAISFDAVTKFLAETYLSSGVNISIISDIITLKLAHNSGVAFSLPIQGGFLQIITVVLIGLIIYQYFQLEYEKRVYQIDIAYVLILAGAFPHAYERIFIGHVIDFISLKYFAILNIADIFISIGVLLLIFYHVRYGSQRKY